MLGFPDQDLCGGASNIHSLDLQTPFELVAFSMCLQYVLLVLPKLWLRQCQVQESAHANLTILETSDTPPTKYLCISKVRKYETKYHPPCLDVLARLATCKGESAWGIA